MKTTMNLLCGAALLVAAHSAVAPSGALDHSSAAGRREAAATSSLANLPFAAQAGISAALGRDAVAYQIQPGSHGFQAANAAQHLAARFTSAGVAVRRRDPGAKAGAGSGAKIGSSFTLALRAYGYANDLRPAPAVVPNAASANRVEYHRGPLTEWYVNGPLGLEQGFTFADPPPAVHQGSNPPVAQPLQIALTLSGDFIAAADTAQKSLTLAPREQSSRERSAADRPAPLEYAGLTATDAAGRELPARLELRRASTPGAQQLLLEVDDTAAHYPIVVDPIIQLAKLFASDGAFDDQLGRSISISGNTVVAGAPYNTTGTNQRQGAVYVFVKPANGWANMSETAKLLASDGLGNDNLGTSVAVSGNTILAGAPFATVGTHLQAGAVYVFVQPPGGWVNATQTAKLIASDSAQAAEFGISVCLDGPTAVVGARRATINRNLAQGAAYVFVEPPGGWADMSETAKLTASDGAPEDNLGRSVSVSGNTIVSGAPLATVNLNQGQGRAYVFVMPPTGWVNMTQTARLTASDGAPGDTLGYSAAVSGSTIVAGSPGATVGSHKAQGAAYVFVMPPGGWVDGASTAKLTASDGAAGAAFGFAAALDGRTAAIGAPRAAPGGTRLVEGVGYVFVQPRTGWINATQTFELTASDGAPQDQFGYAISLSSTTVAAGAHNAKIGFTRAQGAAYIFGQ